MEITYTALTLIDMAEHGHIIIETASSYIEQIEYDLYERHLRVTINGSDYVYYNITFHQFYKFANADSYGSFYNMYIRGRW